MILFDFLSSNIESKSLFCCDSFYVEFFYESSATSTKISSKMWARLPRTFMKR